MIQKIESEIHEKKWGYEKWIINKKEYCLKYLYFREGCKFSMHFHVQKDETWNVDSGIFLLKYICTDNAEMCEMILQSGDTIHIPKYQPHQIICMESGRIIEVSTQHFEEDSFRIIPGDSQM